MFSDLQLTRDSARPGGLHGPTLKPRKVKFSRPWWPSSIKVFKRPESFSIDDASWVNLSQRVPGQRNHGREGRETLDVNPQKPSDPSGVAVSLTASIF